MNLALQQLQHDFVASTLRGARWPACPDEYALQAAAAELLTRTGASVKREVLLSAQDRPDLMCASVVLECKVAGPTAAVLKQVRRYATHSEVDSVVLLTRRAEHLRLPPSVLGKPLAVVHMAAVL